VNISTIQKARLLENLYKIFHTSGVIPNDQEIRKAFNDYFTVNKAGFPLRIDTDVLRSISVTDVDILNSIMANSVFNVDVIFDSIFQNNDQLMGIINALNKKMENLKKRRSELESKVDDLLFSNSNTDGFFYSISENFASLNNIDLNITDAYVNVDKKNVELSSLNSANYNNLTVNNIIASSANASVSANGSVLPINVDLSLFNYVFDGLTDTYWEYEYNSSLINSVSLSIRIPLNNSLVISKVQGTVYTTSPVNIYVIANYVDSTKQSEIRIINSREDYGTFLAAIPADNYSSVDIIMSKVEPDYISSDSSSPYKYKFGLRELMIGSKYYDKQGSIVSVPYSIPSSDNQSIFIDAVSLDVTDQVLTGTDIRYYVAENVENATAISDFNWIPISPKDSESAGYQSLVSFEASTRDNILIKENPLANDLQLIPVNSTSKNINEINPSSSIYANKNVYRVATLNKSLDYINPSLYANVDSFKHYYYIMQDTTMTNYKNLDYWSTEILQNKANILSSILKEQLGSIYPGITSPSSGYMQTKVLSNSDQKVIFTVSKINYNFNLAIYLNGQLIADLPNGTLSKSVEWEFKEGINNLIITYDKPYNGVASFSLMEGTSISRYGSIFVDYFYYLSPFDFANKEIDKENYFTVDTIYGIKQIFSSQKIDGVCRFGYTSKTSRSVDSIRFRADLTRFENPYSTPVLQSYRIKFKHSSV
jgi:hypothetical protein